MTVVIVVVVVVVALVVVVCLSVVVCERDGEGVGDDGSSLRPRIGDYFAPLFDVLFG